MITEILPAGVVVCEAFTDDPATFLFPEEREVISRAVDKRRREFTTVRHCARRALAQLGLPPGPLLPGERGAPSWPAGVVGSMTHCDGYRAAVVARRADFTSVGVDAEPHNPLPEGVLDAIAVPAEQLRHRALTAAASEICWDRLLFSAKEAVYKAWFPLTGMPLDFDEADITLRTDGSFTVRIQSRHVPGAHPLPVGYEGRWRTTTALVATAIAEPASRTPGAGPSSPPQ
ncbi:4'-phosphopantetheinyl transferase superfamily protein [Streptomyces ossamyceticus]|nr:4'-phosphopantetheinyl transferase superfamily protein [Streptomyces ossamyceticus]